MTNKYARYPHRASSCNKRDLTVSKLIKLRWLIPSFPREQSSTPGYAHMVRRGSGPTDLSSRRADSSADIPFALRQSIGRVLRTQRISLRNITAIV